MNITPPPAANDAQAFAADGSPSTSGSRAARWPARRREAFRLFAPFAWSLVATDGPVSVTLFDHSGVKSRIGHNRGVWPMRVAKGAVWKDTATTAYDKNPLIPVAAQFRMWHRSEADRDLISSRVVELLATRARADGGLDQMRNSFVDVGPIFDFALFELECSDVADRAGVWHRDDAGLEKFLDVAIARAAEIRAAGKCGRWDPLEVAISELATK